MASNVKILALLRSDMADEILASLGNAATIKFYTGTQPAGPATAIGAQVLLGTLTGGTPFGTVTNGVLTAGAVTQDSAADATGPATWARIANSGGTAQIDCSVGTSDADIIINTPSLVTGGPITMSSLVITLGGG